jgi:hypothetical protein
MSLTTAAPPEAREVSPQAATFAHAVSVGFLVTFALAHLARPDLDPSWQPISVYALGGRGWLMTLAFLVWGLAPIVSFVALRPHVRTRGGRIGLACLLIGASGPLLAAIFPMDSTSTSGDGMTTSGQLHSLGAVLGDGILVATALLTWSLVRHNPAWWSARWPLIWAATLTWVGAFVLTFCLAAYLPRNGGHLGPEVPMGWPSRLMIVAEVAWLIIAARFAAGLAKGTLRAREPVPEGA